MLVGRRRRAAYARVTVAKKAKKGVAKVSANLAANLKIRSDDKVKVVPLGNYETENRSGDLLLTTKKEVPTAQSVTFSPIEDSLENLVAVEGGDEIADEEIQARFVQPYLEGLDDGVVLKQGHVIRLMDENNKKLEFMISHMDAGEVKAGEDEEEGTGVGTMRTCWVCMIMFVSFSNFMLALVTNRGRGRVQTGGWQNHGRHRDCNW